MNVRTVVTITALCLAAGAHAGIYHVAPDGSDDGDGSLSNPFATPGAAYSAAGSNGGHAVVQLLPGVYAQPGGLVIGNPDILIRGSGPEQTFIQGDVIAVDDASLADLDIGGTLSNAACVLLDNVRLSGGFTGAGLLIGQWRDSADAVSVRGLEPPVDGRDAASMAWVTNHVAANALALAGGALSGDLSLAGDPTAAMHAATKGYVDAATNAIAVAGLMKTGGAMTSGYLVLANAPTSGVHAATKGYVDQAVMSQYDAVVGWNYPSLKAAIQAGCTNIIIRPGNYYEDWNTQLYINRPMRIQGSGKQATRVSVRTVGFSQSSGVIINQLNNGYFEVCDLTLTITNACGNSMRGFFEVNAPALLRFTSFAGSCFAANNELWFIKTVDADLPSISVVCDDIDFTMRTASRAGFMVLQNTRPSIYFRNSRVVIDKMGSGQGTDGSLLCCSVKNSDDGYIFADNLVFVVSNHLADYEFAIQVANAGNGRLKSLILNNSIVDLSLANPCSKGVLIQTDVDYINVNNSFIKAATGVVFGVCNGLGYHIPRVVVDGVAFEGGGALDFGGYPRTGCFATVNNCLFGGAITNVGCKMNVSVGADRASVYSAVTNVGSQYFISSSGGAMATGQLVLAQNPTESMQAATKEYVDNATNSVAASYVRREGDVMTGALIVPEVCVSNNWIVGNGNSRQVIAIVNEAAGSVTWTTGVVKTVSHNLAIPNAEYVILITPTANPGGAFWVSGKTPDSFTVSCATPFSFDYLIMKR
ncbi:hypothetical protein GX586_00800 [bacterium]|nr:hypothetical protein [bacterium]